MKLYELFEDIMNPKNDISKEVQAQLMQIKGSGENKAPINSIKIYLKQNTSFGDEVIDDQIHDILGNLPMVTDLEDDMVYFGDDIEETDEEDSNDSEMTDEEEKDVVSDLASKAKE